MTSTNQNLSLTDKPRSFRETAIFNSTADEKLLDISWAASDPAGVTASDWFALGRRVLYDRGTKEILRVDDTADTPDVVHVFRQIVKNAATDENAVWTSFLPGWPDGSFGWAKVDQHLTGKNIGPKLFVEYIGHGDSDKPTDHSYGTMERADLVEAFWKAEVY